MNQPSFFTASQLRELLPLERLASHLTTAFSELSKSQAAHSPRHVMPIEGGALGLMGGAGQGYVGAKVVCVLPGNKAKGLNPHQGIVALFDPEDGHCLALADASMITALRTAALSLAATLVLAKKDARVLTVVGSGLQAEMHIEAMLKARSSIEEIRIVARTQEKADALAGKFRNTISKPQISTGTELSRFLPDTEILCLCTAATHPYLLASELPDGIHVNAIGACRPGMREIDLNLRDRNHLYFSESIASAREESEELRKLLSGSGQVQEIGNLFLDKCIGRTEPGQVTFFKSVGVGLADACALKAALDQFQELRKTQKAQREEVRVFS